MILRFILLLGVSSLESIALPFFKSWLCTQQCDCASQMVKLNSVPRVRLGKVRQCSLGEKEKLPSWTTRQLLLGFVGAAQTQEMNPSCAISWEINFIIIQTFYQGSNTTINFSVYFFIKEFLQNNILLYLIIISKDLI